MVLSTEHTVFARDAQTIRSDQKLHKKLHKKKRQGATLPIAPLDIAAVLCCDQDGVCWQVRSYTFVVSSVALLT